MTHAMDFILASGLGGWIAPEMLILELEPGWLDLPRQPPSWRARRIHRRTLRRAARAWDRRTPQGKGRTES